MPKHQPKSKLRLIISSHGESLHNIAGKNINSIWMNKLNKLRNHLFENYENTAAINILIDKHLTKYEAKKEFLSYNLLEKVDYYAYYNPEITERGKFQAFYSGKILKDYLEHHNLTIAKYSFSSPYKRTLSSIKQVLKNFESYPNEVLVLPDLMEPFGRFVDKFSIEKTFNHYTVLNEGINVDLIMYHSESDAQIANRIKKGFQKIFKHLREEPQNAVGILMIQGGIMKTISDTYLKYKINEIENPELWDLVFSFDQEGNLQTIDYIDKIEADDFHKVAFKSLISKIQPSENFLYDHDFTVVEDALSWLVKDAKEEIVNSINSHLLKIRESRDTEAKNHPLSPKLRELAKNPVGISKYKKKKLENLKIHKRKQNTVQDSQFNPLNKSKFIKTATPIEMIVLCLFNRGMNISNIKDLLFEIYGYRISEFSISIILNRLQNDYPQDIFGF